MRMIRMINDATIINKGRKERKTNTEIKKPYAVVQYNKFVNGLVRAEQYFSYYPVLRKTVKWPNVSAKRYTLQDILCTKH